MARIYTGAIWCALVLAQCAAPLKAQQGCAQEGCADEKNPEVCDCEKRKELKQKATAAYKDPFYNNDFSYLDDPCREHFTDCHLGESLKRLKPCDGCTLDLGGQYRSRYMNEHNMRGLGLTGRSDFFVLQRTRLYGDVKLGDNLRFYGEYLDAESSFENHQPRANEVNRSDVLNAFGELRLLDHDCGELSFRAGRQEMVLGSQRVVSSLDWANTRRTFDGFNLLWRADDWDVDLFWMRPVFPDRKNFDNPDNSQQFLGGYASYKGGEHGVLDLYFLRYAETQGNPDFDFNTYGVRLQGEWESVLWDCEGAYQHGSFGAADVDAGFFTAGLGYQWKCAPWKPALWVYYDWASGDPVQGAGFHHLFPLAHKYLGIMDLFGRRNLEDLNFQLALEPTEKLRFIAWLHLFQLQRRDDIPYNVALGPSPAPGFAVVPGGSQELGQELDFILDWQMTPRCAYQMGYSRFWSGDWFNTNPTPGLFAGDADFFYLQCHVNF